jgi:hypothetical protein
VTMLDPKRRAAQSSLQSAAATDARDLPDERAHRTSYRKTFVLAAFGVLVAAAIAGAAWLAVPGPLAWVLALTSALAAPAGAVVALATLLALYRDSRDALAKPDLFLQLNKSRSEGALARLPPEQPSAKTVMARLFRWRGFSVGELVEVRSFDEIRATLDQSGSLDGLPFMPEMVPFCGRRFRVYRRVDKIYDYGRTKDLKRLRDTFLLLGLRCTGADHGQCQASCYLLWKGAWLRPTRGLEPAERTDTSAAGRDDGNVLAIARNFAVRAPESGLYACQYTQLAAASAPMSTRDPRQDLRPLVAGNVTFLAFCAALLTRLFNGVQALRGGIPYPFLPGGTQTKTTLVEHRLQPGARVRVRNVQQIAATLNRTNRNLGLWFDREMVKHCGKSFTVLNRVDRLIDDASGKMLQMKAPCLILGGIDASGEFLRFCAQHELPLWREAWLAPEPTDGGGAGHSFAIARSEASDDRRG